MVNIRIVYVTVDESDMFVRVAVRFTRSFLRAMLVLMMLIVRVTMRMVGDFMDVSVFVPFRDA